MSSASVFMRGMRSGHVFIEALIIVEVTWKKNVDHHVVITTIKNRASINRPQL